MAVSAYDRVSVKTEEMSDAIYAALEAIDAYSEEVAAVAADQRESVDPNHGVIHRMEQFEKRAAAMTKLIEDEVLTHLNFCTDRLFSVKTAEAGEFI